MSMSESFRGLSEKKITRRERLRMRALIGGVSVAKLATLTPAELIDVLIDAQSNPGMYSTDANVQLSLTQELAPHRIPEIASLYLKHLHGESPAASKDAATHESDASEPQSWTKPARYLTAREISERLGEPSDPYAGKPDRRPRGDRKPKPKSQGRPKQPEIRGRRARPESE